MNSTLIRPRLKWAHKIDLPTILTPDADAGEKRIAPTTFHVKDEPITGPFDSQILSNPLCP